VFAMRHLLTMPFAALDDAFSHRVALAVIT